MSEIAADSSRRQASRKRQRPGSRAPPRYTVLPGGAGDLCEAAAAAAFVESSTTWLKREWRSTTWGDELDLCPPTEFLEANSLLENGVGLDQIGDFSRLEMLLQN